MPRRSKSQEHFDFMEEASKRPGGEEATIAGREAESDDMNEETNAGRVNSPEDDIVENEVSTSLDDE